MKLFSSLKNIFSKNKINLLYILSFLTFFIVIGDTAFAEGTAPDTKTDEQKNIETINLFFQFLAVIMTLFTNLVGWFLSPEWINGSLLGMDDLLKRIWILVSNLVYFIFAILFIWVALMNIIGRDGENYKLKQAIPKFIVGVLIVPLSWFIVQFVVSISAVLTTAVLSIPYNDFKDVMEKKEGNSPFTINVCPNGYQIVTRAKSKSENTNTNNQNFTIECNATAVGEDGVRPTETDTKKEPITLSKLLTNQNSSPLGILYVYTYGVMKIDQADKLFKGDATDGVNDVMKIIFKYGFSVIIFVVYALLLLALGFALFVRIIWLWLYAMASPVFGLLYFFGKAGEGSGEGAMKNFNFKEFIALAMVPVYVSAALAFGFLFLSMAHNNTGEGTQNKIKDCFVPFGNKAFTICWDGSHLNSAGDTVTPGSKGLFDGSIGTLLGQVFALAFLWIATMAALRSSNITKAVVEPIYAFGQSVGQIVTKGPANLPIIPVPDGKGGMTTLSARGLASAGQNISGAIDSASSGKGTQIGSAYAERFLNVDKDVKELKEILTKNHGSSADKKDRFQETLSALNVSKLDETNYLKQIKENFQKAGAKDEFLEGLNGKLNSQELAQYIFTKKELAGDVQIQQFIADKDVAGIKAILDSKSPAQQVAEAGKIIPTGIVKKDANTITINHLTSNPPAGFKAVDIKLGNDGKVEKIDDFITEISKDNFGYKGVKTKDEFESFLQQAGIKSEDIIEILKQLPKDFFTTPKP